MTKYLNPQPFSGPTSHGHMTDEQYAIAVGSKEFCYGCGKCVPRPHSCPLEDQQ